MDGKSYLIGWVRLARDPGIILSRRFIACARGHYRC